MNTPWMIVLHVMWMISWVVVFFLAKVRNGLVDLIGLEVIAWIISPLELLSVAPCAWAGLSGQFLLIWPCFLQQKHFPAAICLVWSSSIRVACVLTLPGVVSIAFGSLGFWKAFFYWSCIGCGFFGFDPFIRDSCGKVCATVSPGNALLNTR